MNDKQTRERTQTMIHTKMADMMEKNDDDGGREVRHG